MCKGLIERARTLPQFFSNALPFTIPNTHPNVYTRPESTADTERTANTTV